MFVFFKILFLSNLYTQYEAQTYNYPEDQELHTLVIKTARCPCFVLFSASTSGSF